MLTDLANLGEITMKTWLELSTVVDLDPMPVVCSLMWTIDATHDDWRFVLQARSISLTEPLDNTNVDSDPHSSPPSTQVGPALTPEGFVD